MLCLPFPSFHFPLSIFQWVERKRLVYDHTDLCAHTSPMVQNAPSQENRRHIVVTENIPQVFVCPSCSMEQEKREMSVEQLSCAVLHPPLASISIWNDGKCCWGDNHPPSSCCRAARGVSLLPGLPARDPGLPKEAHGLRLHAPGRHHRFDGSYVCSFAFWPQEAGSNGGRHILNFHPEARISGDFGDRQQRNKQ